MQQHGVPWPRWRRVCCERMLRGQSSLLLSKRHVRKMQPEALNYSPVCLAQHPRYFISFFESLFFARESTKNLQEFTRKQYLIVKYFIKGNSRRVNLLSRFGSDQELPITAKYRSPASVTQSVGCNCHRAE